MRLIRCDRCGAEIPATVAKIGYIAVTWQDPRTGDVDPQGNPYDDKDFCAVCMRQIREYIDGRPGKTEAKDTETDAKSEKPARKKIDVTKAQALRDAGWSIKQVADELKTSEPTVRKWTHEPEERKPKPHEWAENEPVLGGK